MSDPRTADAPPHGGTSDPQHPAPEEQVPTPPRREQRIRHGADPRDVATDSGEPQPAHTRELGDPKIACFGDDEDVE